MNVSITFGNGESKTAPCDRLRIERGLLLLYDNGKKVEEIPIAQIKEVIA